MAGKKPAVKQTVKPAAKPAANPAANPADQNTKTEAASQNQPATGTDTGGSEIAPGNDQDMKTGGESPNALAPAGSLPTDDLLASGGDQSETVSQNAMPSGVVSEKIESIPGLEVTSIQPGFRRAGRAWSTSATFVPLTELTEEQIEMLKSEPVLIVKQVEVTAE